MSRVQLPILVTTRKLIIVEPDGSSGYDLIKYDEGLTVSGSVPVMDVVVGASITVTKVDPGNPGHGDPVPVYASEDEAVTTEMNELQRTTNARGRFIGWVDRNRVAIIVEYGTGGGAQSYTEYFDAVPAGDGSVDSAWLADDSVNTGNIADEAVTGPKLGSGSVTGDKVSGDIKSASAGTHSLRKLGGGQYDAAAGDDSRLSNQRVPTDGSVTTGKVATGAITEGKLGSEAVTVGKLGPNSVTSVKINAGAVTEAKLGTDAVTTDKIKNLNVTEAKLGASAVTENKIQADAVTTVKVKDLNITEGKLAGGSVTEGKLGPEAVTSAKIKDGTITDADIASGNKGGPAGTMSMRTLGPGATQAAPGNDARFTALISSANQIETGWIEDGAVTSPKFAPKIGRYQLPYNEGVLSTDTLGKTVMSVPGGTVGGWPGAKAIVWVTFDVEPTTRTTITGFPVWGYGSARWSNAVLGAGASTYFLTSGLLTATCMIDVGTLGLSMRIKTTHGAVNVNKKTTAMTWMLYS